MPLASPSTMRCARRSPSGSAASFGGALVLEGRRVDAREEVEQVRERVVDEVALVVVAAAVPHEVERGLALLVGDLREREDLRRVDDRRVEARLDGLVEEDRVEDGARGRVETEGDVGDAERRVDARVALLEPPRIASIASDAVPSRLFLTRRDGGR